MEKLYVEKGGTEVFNCITLVLTAADLDRPEANIRANALPATSGFFFGKSDEGETEDDLAFIDKARAAILTEKPSSITRGGSNCGGAHTAPVRFIMPRGTG